MWWSTVFLFVYLFLCSQTNTFLVFFFHTQYAWDKDSGNGWVCTTLRRLPLLFIYVKFSEFLYQSLYSIAEEIYGKIKFIL